MYKECLRGVFLLLPCASFAMEVPLPKKNHAKLLQYINEESVFARDLDGNTPLHLVCKNALSMHKVIFNCCVSAFVGLNVPHNLLNEIGQTPLDLCKNIACIPVLRKQGFRLASELTTTNHQ